MDSDLGVDKRSVLTSSRTAPRARIPWLVASVLLASVLGAVIVGQVGNVFVMPQDFADMPLQPSPEYLAKYKAAVSAMYSGNYALHLAILGGCIGTAIGSAAAPRGRLVSALTTALGGTLVGAVGGYAVGWASSYLVNEVQGESITLLGIHIDPIVQTTAVQCFVWSLVGMGIGVGWSLADRESGRIATGIEGGLIGGLLGGMTYSICAAILFTGSNALLFVPEKLLERSVWASIGGLSIAIGLYFSAAQRSSRPKVTAKSPAIDPSA